MFQSTTGTSPSDANAPAIHGPGVRSWLRPGLLHDRTSSAEMQKRAAWYLDIRAKPKAIPAAIHRSKANRGAAPSIIGAARQALVRRKKSSGPSGTTNWPAEIRKNGATVYQAVAQKAATSPYAYRVRANNRSAE